MMKHSIFKKSIVFTLTAAMGLSLCACGGSSTDETGALNTASSHYYKSTSLATLPTGFTDSAGGCSLIANDTLYYSLINDNGNAITFNSYGLLSGDSSTLWDAATAITDENSTKTISRCTASSNGNVYLYIETSTLDADSVAPYQNATLDDVISSLQESYGYSSAEEAQTAWDSDYFSQYQDADGNPDYTAFLTSLYATYTYTYNIEAYSSDGTLLYDYAFPTADSQYINCNGMAADDKGNLFLGVNVWDDSSDVYYLSILDAAGTETGKIDCDSYISNLISVGNGKIGLIGGFDTGYNYYTVTATDTSLGTPNVINTASFIAKDEQTLLTNESGALNQYNLSDASSEKLCTWMDCNISSSSVMNYGILSDGSIAVFTQSWDSSAQKNISDIVILTETNADEAAKVTNINIACLYMDSDLEQKAIAFNKKHDDIHVTMTAYMTDNMEYNDAVTAYNTALATSNNIDIVVFNDFSEVSSLSGKGLLTDLYSLLDSDSEVTRSTFLPSVLSACEKNGALVTLPTSFTLSTVLGKAGDVGTSTGWTLTDMKNLLASKPDGTQLFYGMTRDQALTLCLNLGANEYIDFSNSKCDFDNQDFKDLLEFANLFPENYEYNEGDDEAQMLNSGSTLLTALNLYDFNTAQEYAPIFGDDVTFIGYPGSSDSTGSLFEFTGLYGITEACQNKDAAWQFLRELYQPVSTDTYIYGFSTRQDSFDQACTTAMSDIEQNHYTWSMGSFEFELSPATDAQVSQVKDLISQTTAVNGSIPTEITNIISEEATAYFAGQKTTDEVAGIIQSRIAIYLSETSN